jgi:metallophosphoesterase (TIGR00282 family)
MRILTIGDIVGRPGRMAVTEFLPALREEYGADFVIANGENAAGGFGLTLRTARELYDAGVDVITSGNHIWAQKEIIPYLDTDAPVLRPLNYPPGVPGRGWLIRSGVMVVNLIGRTFMKEYDDPFRAMDNLLETVQDRPNIIFVDFHAEATSEKVALGHYLAGRVSAVLGTHTHVGTIDAMLLRGGTAYVTDIGMTGPADSVIGDDKDTVIERFLTMLPNRLVVANGRPTFTAILVDADDATGKATHIERVSREMEKR